MIQGIFITTYSFETGLGVPAAEISLIITAIENHDKGTASPVNPIAATLIITDKSDVRSIEGTFILSNEKLVKDIHDRLNYAVECSSQCFSENDNELILDLTIDLKSPLCVVFRDFSNPYGLVQKSCTSHSG